MPSAGFSGFTGASWLLGATSLGKTRCVGVSESSPAEPLLSFSHKRGKIGVSFDLRLACEPAQRDAVPTLAQIGNAVIGAFAVDVLILVRRPDAVHIEPRKVMGSILPPIDGNTHIAGTMDGTGHLTSTGVAAPDPAGKHPGLRIIV